MRGHTLAKRESRIQDAAMRHTDEDLDHLASLLNKIPVEYDGMELSTFDGFVAGLIVCPELIMPSEWLSLVWGGKGGGAFTDLAEAEALSTAVMDYYNRVAQTLAETPEAYDPIYGAEINTDDLLWEPWIDGFESAMSLRPDSWMKIVESEDEEAASSVTMVLAMYGICTGETDLNDRAIDEIDKVGSDLIPNIVQTLNAWTKSQSVAPVNVLRNPGPTDLISPDALFHGKKIGRNEPCYCGSGRKYKRCCGAH